MVEPARRAWNIADAHEKISPSNLGKEIPEPDTNYGLGAHASLPFQIEKPLT